MNKTKIIASINHNNYQKNILEEMIINGADAVCLDSSISDYSFILKIKQDIETINQKLNLSIPTMLFLEESCLLTGTFKNDKANLKQNDRIRIHMKPIIGSEAGFSVNYPNLTDYLKSHTIIKLSEGKVVLEVQEIGLDYVVCEVLKGGLVHSNSRIYIPGIDVDRKYLTSKTKDNILFASKINIDYVVLPNIRKEEDILEVNDLLIQHKNNHLGVLAQIENDIAINNIDRIIDVSDGIVIKEDTLAINLPVENIPIIKNKIIIKAREKGKLSIITSKLESVQNTLETSQIANNVSLGVDAILLTSPQELIKEIEKVISVQEKNTNYEYFFTTVLKTTMKNISDTIITSAIRNTLELNCKAIVSEDTITIKKISKYKPKCPIIAIVPDEKLARNLNVYYGVIPITLKEYTFDDIIDKAKSAKALNLKESDIIIIIGSQNKHPDFIKIEEI